MRRGLSDLVRGTDGPIGRAGACSLQPGTHFAHHTAQPHNIDHPQYIGEQVVSSPCIGFGDGRIISANRSCRTERRSDETERAPSDFRTHGYSMASSFSRAISQISATTGFFSVLSRVIA